MGEWVDGRRDYEDGWSGFVHRSSGSYQLWGHGRFNGNFEGDEAACDALHAFLTRGATQEPRPGTVRAVAWAVAASDKSYSIFGVDYMADDEVLGFAADKLVTSATDGALPEKPQRVVVDLLLPEEPAVVVGRVEEVGP